MSTPPRNTLRARTPPTPLHGPEYDDYEPYSPRRSKRSTAQSNPYSSFNGERALNVTPPSTVKRARFARAPTQLSSPPSSPASPVKHQPPQKTPHKHTFTPRKTANGAGFDPLHSQVPAHVDPVTMLPTPSKTPRKRVASTASARILTFQPDNPNDVMPSARKIRKQASRPHATTVGFELYEDDAHMREDEQIAIYTDANARVPEMDESEDNPFVGKRMVNKRPQRRRIAKSAAEVEREREIDDAVKRDEGVTYVFRGRKIFRKFEDGEREDGASSAASELSGTPEQRRLKRQAGAAAQRPLTRSAIQPRLLFPSEEQQLERDRRAQEVDEEAVTDIEMPNASSPVMADMPKDALTPVHNHFKSVTPPPTIHATRSKGKKAMQRSTNQSSPDGATASVNESFSATASDLNHRRKARSPFAEWKRTKTGAGKKRAGDGAELAGGKRSRNDTSASTL